MTRSFLRCLQKKHPAKFNTQFRLKSWQMKGNFLKLIKVICIKTNNDITINGRKASSFPLRPGARKGCPL